LFSILYDINHGDYQCLRLCCQKQQTAIKNIAVAKELQFFIDKEPVSETELESKFSDV
jgi:hypothetical protein